MTPEALVIIWVSLCMACIGLRVLWMMRPSSIRQE
jgi:hypothetical protein